MIYIRSSNVTYQNFEEVTWWWWWSTWSVGHDRELCKNGWTDRDVVSGMDSNGPKEPWRGSRSPNVKGQFWERKGAYPG